MGVDYTFMVQMRMATIEVPVGQASGSEAIWSYLDEERTRAVRSASFGRNGMRIGVAGLDTWPDLMRILQKLTGRQVKEEMAYVTPGRSFHVELKGNQGPQTIFTSYNDRTLSGCDYPGGDNLLVINCSLDPESNSRIVLTGVPQIRSTQRKVAIASGGVIGAAPDAYNFEQVTFQLTLASRDLILIGPGAESRRPTSIGYHFLLKDRDDVQFETVLVLIPEVIKAPIIKSSVPN